MVCGRVVASGCFRGGMFGQATDGWVEALSCVCFVEQKKTPDCDANAGFDLVLPRPARMVCSGISVLGFESIGGMR